MPDATDNPLGIPAEITHPVDALKDVAERAGLSVDSQREAEMRAICDEIVDASGCGLPQAERKGDWMQTYTGRQYWPLDPRPDDVDGMDIAHHLSNICRYCGACLRFYSVAEHSVGVLDVAVREGDRHRAAGNSMFLLQRHALLHDAPEAYCHDLIRPIKRCVEGYAEVEAANADAVAIRFGLGLVGIWAGGIIKQADNAMLLAEQERIMAPAPAKWAKIDVPPAMLDDARAYLRRNVNGWSPMRARMEFLQAMEALDLN